jgi:hypothetical protein
MEKEHRMKPRIHFVVRPEPISHHGQDQRALCGATVFRAQPVIIVPDAIVVSVGMIADQFGSKMCRYCKMLEPAEGYIYFATSEEHLQEFRTAREYAETA